MNMAATFIQSKVASGELDEGYLADGFKTLLEMAADPEPSDMTKAALADPFHWLVGYYGYSTEFFSQEG
jgi:hypothetical protein